VISDIFFKRAEKGLVRNNDDVSTKHHSLNNGLDTSKAFEIEENTNYKKQLLKELVGSWSDADDTIIDDIYKSRNTSDKKLTLTNNENLSFRYRHLYLSIKK